jgi:hypothetical protein
MAEIRLFLNRHYGTAQQKKEKLDCDKRRNRPFDKPRRMLRQLPTEISRKLAFELFIAVRQ